MRHGLRGHFGGCRCQRCVRAWATYCREKRYEREGNLAPDDPRHGRYSTYINHRCRCEPCRAAGTAYAAMRRERVRRAQA